MYSADCYDTFQREAILMPYLSTLSTFRDTIRQLAIAQAPAKDILALCDKLRDIDLAPLGVALDDQEGMYFSVLPLLGLDVSFTDGRALVKLVDPESLLRAREEKAAQAAEKAAKKEAQAKAEAEKKRARIEKGRVSPSEMFKPPNVPDGTYGTWNADGIPLTDGEGAEITKSKGKKITKEWEAQKKLHTEWVEWSKTQS